MSKEPDVKCARCNRIIDPGEPARIELECGRVVRLALTVIVGVAAFRRAWHEDCFG